MYKVSLNVCGSVVAYEVEGELKLPSSLCIDKLIKCLKEDIHLTDDVPLRNVPSDCEVTVALRRERFAVHLKDCCKKGKALSYRQSILNISPLQEITDSFDLLPIHFYRCTYHG
jgi:hypothetical protein